MISIATRIPRAAAPAAVHSITRRCRQAADGAAALPLIRENTRDALDINRSADLFDMGEMKESDEGNHHKFEYAIGAIRSASRRLVRQRVVTAAR
ncbi:hypothetical protein [Streptomyces filipinensis]|uniref:hypothetical protein n=1 Tax=Streptomyces filipinensis TaxID=66887 RepID=UPI00177B4ADA|nr:hypothetical protein [Streptomyces filipinensis]